MQNWCSFTRCPFTGALSQNHSADAVKRFILISLPVLFSVSIFLTSCGATYQEPAKSEPHALLKSKKGQTLSWGVTTVTVTEVNGIKPNGLDMNGSGSIRLHPGNTTIKFSALSGLAKYRAIGTASFRAKSNEIYTLKAKTEGTYFTITLKNRSDATVWQESLPRTLTPMYPGATSISY